MLPPVWRCRLGESQVLKKWLSHQGQGVLRRALQAEAVQHFTDTARRIGGTLRLWEREMEG